MSMLYIKSHTLFKQESKQYSDSRYGDDTQLRNSILNCVANLEESLHNIKNKKISDLYEINIKKINKNLKIYNSSEDLEKLLRYAKRHIESLEKTTNVLNDIEKLKKLAENLENTKYIKTVKSVTREITKLLENEIQSRRKLDGFLDEINGYTNIVKTLKSQYNPYRNEHSYYNQHRTTNTYDTHTKTEEPYEIKITHMSEQDIKHKIADLKNYSAQLTVLKDDIKHTTKVMKRTKSISAKEKINKRINHFKEQIEALENKLNTEAKTMLNYIDRKKDDKNLMVKYEKEINDILEKTGPQTKFSHERSDNIESKRTR